MAELGICKTCGGMVSSEAATCPHCGQADPFATGGLDEVKRLAGRGRKIEAIKRYRELTGKGLAEAKESVEALTADADPGAPAAKAASSPFQPFLLLAIAMAVALVAWLLFV